MHHLKEEEIFLKQVSNAREQTLRNEKTTLFKFLDQRKQEIIKQLFIHNEDLILFHGGFEDAEYNRCIISPFKKSKENLKVSILKIKHNKKYLSLTHRNILGNLMSMGIKRESIGDIHVVNGIGYFACSLEIKDFLIDEFKTFNNMPISLEEVENAIVGEQEKYEEENILVSSLRLDLFLSKVFDISRNESKEIILDKRVKVNHVASQNISQILKEGDLLSVNKKGRIKFIKTINISSKGKIKVLVGKLR